MNEAAHAERRNAFLDTAQRLIGTKGYEQMTIQDVLDDLGASKGALYHYFDSKQSLLKGIVERYAEAVEVHLARCAADPELTALEYCSTNSVFSARPSSRLAALKRFEAWKRLSRCRAADAVACPAGNAA